MKLGFLGSSTDDIDPPSREGTRRWIFASA
jgi:hypothetical protein